MNTRLLYAILLATMILLASILPTYSAECPEGYVCVTVDEARQLRAKNLDLRAAIVTLTEERDLLKIQRKRFGWSVGCGYGVAFTTDVDWDMQVAPAGVCGVVFDFWRF